jgi:hypothetical protein
MAAAFLSLVKFEAEKRGAAPMSLDPTIEMTGLWLVGREFHRWKYRFVLEADADRSPPGDQGLLDAWPFSSTSTTCVSP